VLLFLGNGKRLLSAACRVSCSRKLLANELCRHRIPSRLKEGTGGVDANVLYRNLFNVARHVPEADFWTASQNCSQVPSERTQLAE
jgi:hypothetical protein